jgi:hypothetical protein
MFYIIKLKKTKKTLPRSRSYLHRTFWSSDWMKKVVEMNTMGNEKKPKL